jgi:hypothetical protein
MDALNGISISIHIWSLLVPNAFLRIAARFNMFSGDTTEQGKPSRKKA